MKKISIAGLLGLVAWGMLVSTSMAQSWNGERDRVAVSPYAQVGGTSSSVAGNFYTFLAFTHPSLSTAVSQIEVTVFVEGPADNLFEPSGDRSETFTINAGETHKVFIVATNHDTIVSTNPFFGSRDHFIATSANGINANIRVVASNTTPTAEVTTGKYNNLNQLSMWGVIFQPSNGAGFAMEFIGDMHDSTILSDGNGGNVVTLQTGRGIN